MINVICANLLLVPTKTIAQPGIVAKLTHSRAVEASNTKIQTSVITFRRNTTKSYYTSTLLLFMYTHRFYIDEFFQHISTVFQSLQRKPVKIQGRILLKWFSWKRADIFSASLTVKGTSETEWEHHTQRSVQQANYCMSNVSGYCTYTRLYTPHPIIKSYMYTLYSPLLCLSMTLHPYG